MQMWPRVTGTRRERTVISWMRTSSGRITFLTSSASRSVRCDYARRSGLFCLAPSPPSRFFTGHHRRRRSPLLLPLSLRFPLEGNLEGRRIKVSLPLQSAFCERISSRTTERRRAARRRSERVAERFGAITSFRFSKPACVKEHVCRPAIKYWWAPLMVRYGRAREPS